MLKDETTFKGTKHRFTYTETDSHKKFSPLTQSYGICFTPEGKVLVGRPPSQDHWTLPGGTIEDGETPEEALERELDEEVSCDLLRHQLLGVQRVEYPESDKKTRHSLRYACLVRRKKLTPDPAKGETWIVKEVHPDELNNHLQWGKIHDHIIKQAEEWHEQR